MMMMMMMNPVSYSSTGHKYSVSMWRLVEPEISLECLEPSQQRSTCYNVTLTLCHVTWHGPRWSCDAMRWYRLHPAVISQTRPLIGCWWCSSQRHAEIIHQRRLIPQFNCNRRTPGHGYSLKEPHSRSIKPRNLTLTDQENAGRKRRSLGSLGPMRRQRSQQHEESKGKVKVSQILNHR